MIEVYSTGIDLRLMSSISSNETVSNMKERWDRLNLSFNYIGEVLDVDKVASNIKNIDFESNFINLFINRKRAYAVVNSNIFETDFTTTEDDCNLGVMIKTFKY